MPVSQIRTLPITENPENAWKNAIARAVNANGNISDSGVSVDSGPNGYVIGLGDPDDKYPVLYAGDYDFNSEYFPNEIVRVRPDVVYKNQDGSNIPIGDTTQTIDQDMGDLIPISIGCFICVNYVPPGGSDTTWLSAIQAQTPSQVPFAVAASTRFYDYNVYYPIYPEIPGQYTASVVTPEGCAIVSNQKYWDAMPVGCIAAKLCQNGVEKNFYVMGFMSGSLFDPSNLPYSP